MTADPMTDERLAQIRPMVAGLEPYVSIPPDREEWHYAVKDLLAEVDRLRSEVNRLTCQCCFFGNHSIKCTCDGADCCHPQAYLDYNPKWGHGNG